MINQHQFDKMRKRNGALDRAQHNDSSFFKFRKAFYAAHNLKPGELTRHLIRDRNSELAQQWREGLAANTEHWCSDCRGFHKPTVEHPFCKLCEHAVHAPRPKDIYFDFRGWKFTPPFICMGCGIEVCYRQWAQTRSCGACDISDPKTQRLLGRGQCFAGPHERLPKQDASDIPADHFVDPAQRDKYPVIARPKRLNSHRPRPRMFQ